MIEPVSADITIQQVKSKEDNITGLDSRHVTEIQTCEAQQKRDEESQSDDGRKTNYRFLT